LVFKACRSESGIGDDCNMRVSVKKSVQKPSSLASSDCIFSTMLSVSNFQNRQTERGRLYGIVVEGEAVLRRNLSCMATIIKRLFTFQVQQIVLGAGDSACHLAQPRYSMEVLHQESEAPPLASSSCNRLFCVRSSVCYLD
jgi:hypothetical protein